MPESYRGADVDFIELWNLSKVGRYNCLEVQSQPCFLLQPGHAPQGLACIPNHLKGMGCRKQCILIHHEARLLGYMRES